jgi:plasmid stabilization system protein ParE
MIEYLPVAEQEFSDAMSYYESERPGLGYEFALEAKRTAKRIEDFPTAWSLVGPRARRCSLDRFPYFMLYHVRAEMILIVGIFHESRDPISWKDRIRVTSE